MASRVRDHARRRASAAARSSTQIAETGERLDALAARTACDPQVHRPLGYPELLGRFGDRPCIGFPQFAKHLLFRKIL